MGMVMVPFVVSLVVLLFSHVVKSRVLAALFSALSLGAILVALVMLVAYAASSLR